MQAVGSPAVGSWDAIKTRSEWLAQLGRDGGLDAKAWKVVEKAVLDQCDGIDGVRSPAPVFDVGAADGRETPGDRWRGPRSSKLPVRGRSFQL